MRKLLPMVLSILALVVGVAYILVAHPPLAGALAIIGTALGLCVVSSLS